MPIEAFRSFTVYAPAAGVDRSRHAILGVTVAQAGVAAGHRLLFDAHSLQQLLELGSRKPAGVKSRFTHPGLSQDGLGKYLGRVRSLRLEGERLVGDLFLAESAARSPSGDLREYMLSLAEEDPASFGMSVVVDLERTWVRADGSEAPTSLPRPDNSLYQFPVARVSAFHAADCVDEPALNPQGLFNLSGHLIVDLNDRKEELMEVASTPSPSDPGETSRFSTLERRLAEVEGGVTALQSAVAANTIQIGGTPPRGRIDFLPSGLELAQQAWDWVFGVQGARLPPPELRRTDALYRLITGDGEWHGVFHPEAAFATATTTTLADLAVNAMNKVVVQLYDRLSAYRWYEKIVAVQATDGSLQDMAWIQFGGIANLPQVAEGAAYTELNVADTKESDSFTKYGGYVGITDKMLRNSEIAKLQAIPRALTLSAIQTRSAAIAGIFTANSGAGPTLDQDSTALFHANHANLATSAYAWSAWKAARLECMKQTELGSGKRQVLLPKFLLVPPDLYDTALIDFGYGQGSGGRPATADNDVNPYAESRPGDPRVEVVMVPDWTDTNDWAYIADPLIAPILCMAYADNPGGRTHPTPQLYTVTNPAAGLLFTNDVMPIKVRDYYAYGVATFRGIGKRNVT